MLAAALSFLLVPAFAEFPAPERSTAPISIVYPPQGASLSGEGTMVLGSVQPASGIFTINGQTVPVRDSGAFLTWVPLQSSSFTLAAHLTAGTTVHTLERQVFVAPPQAPLPEKPMVIEPLWPRSDEELRAGDWLLTRARVPPGAKAEYRLHRKMPWQPMRDLNPGAGIVEGSYLVRADDEQQAAAVEFRVNGGHEARSPGQVTITRATPLVASIRGQAPVMVRTGPGEGDLFFAQGGTRFVIGGRKGSESKILLANNQVGWVDTKVLEFLPPGAHPPRAETETIGIKAGDGATIVRVTLGDRVPYFVEESEDLTTLTVRFHYAYLHTNWMVYNASDDLVDEVRVRQETNDIVAMTVRLKPGHRLWGYWPTFEGNALRLELKHPPKLAKSGSPLAGVRVFLDPGHMPSAPGALGPLGTKEMDVNLAIARSVERLLLKEKAVPLLSRLTELDEVSLQDRPRMAVEKKADVFVSIHNNFLAGARNPYKESAHGYSTFYYHPHSLELARHIHEGYVKRVPLANEDLRFGNLLVCRLTAMPAVLTETAYLTYPEQEALLLEASFREKAAEAIVDGLRSFFKGQKELQR